MKNPSIYINLSLPESSYHAGRSTISEDNYLQKKKEKKKLK